MKNDLHYFSSQRRQPRAHLPVHCGAQAPSQKILPDITRNRADYGSNHVHRSRLVVRLVTDRLTAGART